MFNKYSATLKPRVEDMFSQLSVKARETIKFAPTVSSASQSIAEIVASETTMRSKTMLEDMYSYLSKQVLEQPIFSDTNNQNRFYELNLRKELFDKYRFDVPVKGIDYIEANRTVTSVAASVGTGIVGGVLIAAISPTSLVVPVAIVIGAAVATFCVSYFKAVPDMDKGRFATALDEFLATVKEDLLNWFDEIQAYFERRVQELINSL